jgi:hypothetical protein
MTSASADLDLTAAAVRAMRRGYRPAPDAEYDDTAEILVSPEPQIVSGKLKKNPPEFPQRRRPAHVDLPRRKTTKGAIMRKIILTLAAVAVVGTAAMAPAEARGFGRGAAIGAGVAAGAIGAAAAGAAYNNGYGGYGYDTGYGPGYGYAPSDGYYAEPGYYENDGPPVYEQRVYPGYNNW